jgi:hypothetical protein
MKIAKPTDSQLLDSVVGMHQGASGPGGITSGYCQECGTVWPCPTVHVAMGWGDWEDCWEEHFCNHAGVRLE